MAPKTITLQDVAKASGFSKSAVSAALSGNRSTISLTEETRNKILQAAKKLNYRPNILAKSMSEQRSFLIGLLLSDVNTALATELIRGIQDQAVGHGYAPVVFSHGNPQQERDNLKTCMDRKVDALIVNAAVGQAARTGREGLAPNVPLVEVLGRQSAPWVVLDYRASGRIATQHLLELGHRRIAMLTYDQSLGKPGATNGEHWNAREHFLGYQETMEHAGLTTHVLTHPLLDTARPELAWTDQVAQAAPDMLAGTDRPTAVICYDDRQAYGLVRACRGLGLEVPADLSIVGHLDREASELIEPALTSLRVPAAQLGARAAQMCFDLMDDQPVSNTSFEPQLITRGSTAPPKAKRDTA